MPYQSRSSKLDKSFKMWMGLWIAASIALFAANTLSTPGFWWSGPFIILWSVLMGAQALKFDRQKRRDAQRFLYGGQDDEAMDLLEQEKNQAHRQWKESDFV